MLTLARMIIAPLPLIVCLVGLLIWAFAALTVPTPPPSPGRPFAAEVGKWMFICGLIITLAIFSGLIHVPPR
jgi:hypothetical protein